MSIFLTAIICFYSVKTLGEAILGCIKMKSLLTIHQLFLNNLPAHTLEKSMKISVIVPVYQHWDIAFHLIDALEQQNLDKRFWELILVDNGSDIVPDVANLPSFSTLLYCSKPGSYAARNKGLDVAKGELIVFTDADCRPNPDWLSQLWSHYQAGAGSELIAGAVKVTKFGTQTANDVELYDMTMGLPQESYTKRGYGVTANLAVPKQVFDKVGHFDESRFSGGDAEICRRARNNSFSLKYEPAAIVEHPARASWLELETKVKRVKGGQIKSGEWSRKTRYFIRTFIPPVRAYLKVIRCSFLNSSQKLKVLGIQSKLWRVEMIEVLRLSFGKQPERR